MRAHADDTERGLLYVSRQEVWVRLLIASGGLLAAASAWLLVLPPWSFARGSAAVWALPVLFAVLLLTIPALVLLFHDRYVLRIVIEADGRLRITTLLLWGRRTHWLRPREIVPHRFLLVRSGLAPLGFDTLAGLGLAPARRGGPVRRVPGRHSRPPGRRPL